MSGAGMRPPRATGRGGAGGRGGPGGPAAGPMGRGMAMPAAKPRTSGARFRRLLGELRPERRLRSLVVMVLAVVSVAFSVLGPKILGNATEHHLRGRRQQAAAGRR